MLSIAMPPSPLASTLHSGLCHEISNATLANDIFPRDLKNPRGKSSERKDRRLTSRGPAQLPPGDARRGVH